jgi:hypothetical protein
MTARTALLALRDHRALMALMALTVLQDRVRML